MENVLLLNRFSDKAPPRLYTKARGVLVLKVELALFYIDSPSIIQCINLGPLLTYFRPQCLHLGLSKLGSHERTKEFWVFMQWPVVLVPAETSCRLNPWPRLLKNT